jgi:hypothetical protein
MKLLQASSAALVGMALCSALYAYQRTADFGFGDDAETNALATTQPSAAASQAVTEVMVVSAATAGATPGPGTTRKRTARFCWR